MGALAYLRKVADVKKFFYYFIRREPSLRALQEEVQRKSLILQRQLLDSTRNLLEVDMNTNWWPDVVPPGEPLWDDPEFFNPMWSGQNVPPTLDKTLRGEILPVYVNWYGLKLIRDYSRRQAQYNPYAMCAIENRCSYICGRGFSYKLVPRPGKDSPEVHYLCSVGQRVIDQFHSSQNWSEKEHETILRCDRDGEAFMRFFHVGDGRTEARFIEPEWVRGPNETETQSYGVINQELDIESVLGYWMLTHPPYTAPEEVPAEEVIHYKFNSDSTSKRGLPTLFPVRANLDRAEKLLRNMSVLAQVQATFAVIRKHKQYSQGAVQGFQQGQADISFASPANGQTMYGQRMMPGTILDIPDNEDYQFPSHGIDAGGLVHVLQAELRAVAARLVMPEYMLTANAEGSNFAAIAISESPSVKNFERLQSYFARRFGSGSYAHPRNCGAMWRVLRNAVEYGGVPRELLTLCELQVEGPSLIARNKDAETRRYASLNQAGILSKSSWSKFESLDRDNERKLWEREHQEDNAIQAKDALFQAQTQLQAQMMQQQVMGQQQQQLPPEQQQQVTQQQAPQQNGQELGIEQEPPRKAEEAGVYSELHDLVGGKQFFESIKHLPIGTKVTGPSGRSYIIATEVLQAGPWEEAYRERTLLEFANGSRLTVRKEPDTNTLWELCNKVIPKESPATLPAEIGTVDGCRVLIVDGDVVKTTHDMDFVEGGNDLELIDRYGKSYIPPKEVWLDNNIQLHDLPFILMHELVERRALDKGKHYAEAHDQANRVEKHLRKIALQQCPSCGHKTLKETQEGAFCTAPYCEYHR